MPLAKKGSRKRKEGTKRVSKRRATTIYEDDGTQVEDITTPEKRKGKSKPDKRKLNMDSPVLQAQLRKFCIETLRVGVNGLLEQFVEIRQSTAQPVLKTCFDANEQRNRYKDVICVDNTRVVLKWPPDNRNDYIHANWVDFKDEKKFICAQAPIESTIDDFWRLVWQEKCKAIVMLCELVEQNRKKCEPYYPVEPNATMNTKSGLVIKNTTILPIENIITATTLSITFPPDSETLTVKHFKWNCWPDRGVPENRMAAMRLISRFAPYDPILIHCSAGIGRTGTIVGLYMALQVMSAGEDLVLANVVKELRAQRHGSVQTDTQYVFMHRVLIGLAENKSLVTVDDTDKFIQEYDAFVKSRGG